MRVYCPVPPDTAGSRPAPAPDAVIGSVADSRHWTIGVLDDHLDPPFMEALVDRLHADAGGAKVHVWIKPLGTAPAPDDIILEMAEEVRLALVGVGL